MGLNKVTYQDLVTVIAAANLNDIQDAIIALEGILPSIAPEYSVNNNYAVGDYVVYQNVLYKCTSPTSGAWNPSKWTAVNFGDEMESYKTDTEAELRTLFADLVESITTEYSATAMYDVGDIVEKDGLIYRCITPIITPEAWTASHWTAIDLSNEITSAQRDATEGYSDTLTAGDLTSDEYQTDDEPYLFRRTYNGACNHAMDVLTGGTVAWNQLVQNGDFADGTTGWIATTATVTANNNVAHVNASSNYGRIQQKISNSAIIGHKYLILASLKADSDNSGKKVRIGVGTTTTADMQYMSITLATDWQDAVFLYDNQYATERFIHIGGLNNVCEFDVKNIVAYNLTQMFGSTIADAVYAMEQAEAGSGVAWFRRYFPEDYYSYDAGTLKSVEAVAHRMTGKNMFPRPYAQKGNTNHGINYTIQDDGTIIANGTASGGNANLILIDNTAYDFKHPIVVDGCPNGGSSSTYRIFVIPEQGASTQYDTGNGVVIQQGTIYRYVIVIYSGYTANNLVFKPMIRYADEVDTAFEPVKQHTYKLDSSLTLRGIPKLTNGKLTYDGDTYEPSGQVVRRYGVVDLGTLTWTYNGNSRYTSNGIATLTKKYANTEMPNMVSEKFRTIKWGSGLSDNHDGITLSDTGTIYTYSESNTAPTPTGFLVYELATPITESASPYEPTQVVYADGTEEYISNSIVPVGHVTRYPVSIKAKIYELIDTVAQLQALVLENISNS